MAKRRRSKKAEADAIATLAIIAIIGIPIVIMVEIFKAVSQNLYAQLVIGGVVITGIVGLIIAWNRKRMIVERLQKDLEEGLSQVEVSSDRADYLIESDDYKRGNPKENLYRKAMKLPLIAAYENKCAKCGANDNGLDIDHFFLSKNAGGCFIMRHRGGYLVNNAIPLCHTCNRSKSDSDFRNFFTRDELLNLFKINATLTKQLNEKNLLAESGQVKKKKRA